MEIRRGTIGDLEELAAIERVCFPSGQAAGEEQIRERLKVFPEHFVLLCDDSGKIISFIDGFVTDIPDLTDEMYATPQLHNEGGSWQMVFGLNTLPGYRNRGYAGRVLNELIRIARKEGRRGVVLTCRQELVDFYGKFGFVNEGITEKSVHGGIEWYQMRRFF